MGVFVRSNSLITVAYLEPHPVCKSRMRRCRLMADTAQYAVTLPSVASRVCSPEDGAGVSRVVYRIDLVCWDHEASEEGSQHECRQREKKTSRGDGWVV